MYPNIVCFCGFPLGQLYDAFLAMLAKHREGKNIGHSPNEPIGYILDQLGITKTCCRTRIMTNMEFKNYYSIDNGSKLAPSMDLTREIPQPSLDPASARVLKMDSGDKTRSVEQRETRETKPQKVARPREKGKKSDHVPV